MNRPPSPFTMLLSRHTRRRTFIAGLVGAAAWPLVARAQQPGKIPRIGVLWSAPNEEVAIYLGAFRQGLNDVGYILPSWGPSAATDPST
jgi:hypothetical protein